MSKKGAFVCAIAGLLNFWMIPAALAVPLSTLLMPGASLTSQDGSVTFNNFVYMVTPGAPPATNVDVSSGPMVPCGLRVQGAFQASNGLSVDVIFGFDAHLNAGAFTAAELNMILSSALGTITGPGGQILAQSSVVIDEEITPLPGPGPETDLVTVDDVVGPDQFFSSAALNPAVYGANIRVRKDIGLISVMATQGVGVASLSLFTQNFVPEPSSLLLLLVGGLVARRVRRPS
jgi:hypothetical protein